jgi:hypothetical protein
LAAFSAKSAVAQQKTAKKPLTLRFLGEKKSAATQRFLGQKHSGPPLLALFGALPPEIPFTSVLLELCFIYNPHILTSFHVGLIRNKLISYSSLRIR